MQVRRVFQLPALSLVLSCGARTRGNDPPPHANLKPTTFAFDAFGHPTPRCHEDADCRDDLCARYSCVQTFCVEVDRVQCEDNPDPCSTDDCDPKTGDCVTRNATPDEDGDGHYAARPGYAPGAPLSCGDDCDDTDATSFPSGVEVCDGHDNDCNGTIDDGFSFSKLDHEPVLISVGAKEAGLGGLVHDGDVFVLSYSSRFDNNESVLLGMHAPDDVAFRSDIALTNSDSYAGPVAWTGSQLTTAWEDRRDEDFEIYYNRFDAKGRKLGPDLRLSVADDFSLNPSLVFVGRRQAVFWQDRRDASVNFQIYAQWVDERGQLSGENENVSSGYYDAEDPSLALGQTSLGLLFNADLEGRQVVFQPLDFELQSAGSATVISQENAVGASLSYVGGHFVALWHEYDKLPGDAIWGAVVDSSGTVLREPERVTEPADFARGHDVIALGDRLLLLFTQYTEGSYDVFLRELDPDLNPLTDAVRVTATSGDVLGASMAIGDGRLGVAYMDYGQGAPQLYFLTLACE